MRLRDGKAAPPLAGTDAAGVIGGGPDRDGSRDESFFEAKPWLDSDSDDDFHSVRGDFTPSRGSTPDRYSYRQTPLSWRGPVDSRPKSSLLVEKKQRRLFELLQEKQHYDDEDDDSATDVSSGDMENNRTVHAEEHLEPSRKGGKVNKSSKPGCFPTLIWKHNFKMSSNTKKEQKAVHIRSSSSEGGSFLWRVLV